MKIDSGTHDAIINSTVWRAIGSPQLEPFKGKRLASTGAEVPLLGYFIADVSYCGRLLQLPVQVSKKEDTRNLIGRRWFSELNVDWNHIFRHNISSSVSHLLPNEIARRHSSLGEEPTQHIRITIEIDGAYNEMVFDSGSTVSAIGINEWELMGSPALSPCKIKILDTANKPLSILGQFLVNVGYEGRYYPQLPLCVVNKPSKNVVGTNWYHAIDFDFNTIFGATNPF